MPRGQFPPLMGGHDLSWKTWWWLLLGRPPRWECHLPPSFGGEIFVCARCYCWAFSPWLFFVCDQVGSRYHRYYYVREDVRCEWTVGSGCGKIIGSSILQHEKNNHLHSIKLYGNGRTTHTDLAVDRRLPLWL